MSKTVVNEQFAVRYDNHYSGKTNTLGNYDAAMDTTDVVRELEQQGFKPRLLRRRITVSYGDWEEV